MDNEEDVAIMNEYDEMVSIEEFIELVKRKQKENNPDNFTHADNINGYRFTDGDFS